MVSYASIATSLGKCAQVCFEQLLSGRQTFEYILSEWIALIIHLLPIVITSAADIRAFFVTTLLDMSVPLLQPAHRSSEAARIAAQLVARGLISLFHILADELNLHVASAGGAGSAAGGRSGFDDFVASVGRLFAPRSSSRPASDEVRAARSCARRTSSHVARRSRRASTAGWSKWSTCSSRCSTRRC